MGKQTELRQLEGSVGNVTFYKSPHGPIAEIKAGPSKSKIENSPTFEKLRQQNSEFGRAGLATRLFKKVFRPIIKGNSDSALSSRLLEVMIRVIQADLVNPRGKRNVVDGEAELLRGFEFNQQSSLDSILAVEFTSTIDRVSTYFRTRQRKKSKQSLQRQKLLSSKENTSKTLTDLTLNCLSYLRSSQ